MSNDVENIGKAVLHSDVDGLITLQCNKCKTRFKLEGSFIDDELEGEICCPICGISSELDSFYPEEVISAAIELAKAYVEELVYKSFKGLNSKYLKVTVPKPTTVDKTKDFIDKDINMQTIHLECCNKNISLLPIDVISSYYCPYCGRIIK